MTTTNFGRETSCTTELRTGRFVSGPRLVAEALFRRYTTPRGMLRGGEEEARYGLDLQALIGKASTPALVAALPGQIQAEGLKDQRVSSVAVDVLEVDLGGAQKAFDITINGQTAEGPFTLQIRASALSITLLGIKEG